MIALQVMIYIIQWKYFSFLFIKVDKNGDVRLVIGAAGGTKITTAVALAMILNLWSGYNVNQAIDTVRIHHQV